MSIINLVQKLPIYSVILELGLGLGIGLVSSDLVSLTDPKS